MNELATFFKFIKSNRISRHVLFWLLYFILDLFGDIVPHDHTRYVSLREGFIFNLIGFLTRILTSYFIAYFWVPEFIKRKKYLLGVVVFIIVIYFLAVLDRFLVVYVGEPLIRTPPFAQESIAEIFYDIKWLLLRYIPKIWLNALVFLAVKYYFESEREKEIKLSFEKEKARNELKVLKSQLNPHFLFNTLNNIYALSISNSPQTAVSIGKLSEILDHALYKCDSKFVSLKSEIDLLENYISLEKLRYNDRLKIDFNSQINNDFEIPPLILLSLVENAFKHGAGEDSGSPEIGIDIYSNNNRFMFKIYNTIASNYQSKNKRGIGLLNIEKQLNLIYKKGYNLIKEEEGNKFTVLLEINKNS